MKKKSSFDKTCILNVKYTRPYKKINYIFNFIKNLFCCGCFQMQKYLCNQTAT
jgi:hypothetical protein